MSGEGAGRNWSCATCGAQHTDLAAVFGSYAPDPWAFASDKERRRGAINRDMCVIRLDGQKHFFIRGELQLPVVDAAIETFTWSVWVSLSREAMRTTRKYWNRPERVDLPPMFGWLCNLLSPYAEPTSPLPTHVHTRAPGVSPLIELDPATEHELVREQLEGISLHRVAELNELLLGQTN